MDQLFNFKIVTLSYNNEGEEVKKEREVQAIGVLIKEGSALFFGQDQSIILVSANFDEIERLGLVHPVNEKVDSFSPPDSGEISN